MSGALPQTSPSKIANLIIEARAGSSEALGQLMAFSREYLLLIACDELGAELQAKANPSDLVQETQMDGVRGFVGFRGATASELLGWLREILLRNIIDFKRYYTSVAKRSTSREVPLADPAEGHGDVVAANQPTPVSKLYRDEQARKVEEAVAQLPEDYQQVVLWRHRDDCSFEEIGERLGRTESAARKLWSRAVQQLRKHLKPPHESH